MARFTAKEAALFESCIRARIRQLQEEKASEESDIERAWEALEAIKSLAGREAKNANSRVAPQQAWAADAVLEILRRGKRHPMRSGTLYRAINTRQSLSEETYRRALAKLKDERKIVSSGVRRWTTIRLA